MVKHRDAQFRPQADMLNSLFHRGYPLDDIEVW